MKKIRDVVFLLAGLLILSSAGVNKGYKVGDKARNFSLKNVNGQMISLDDFEDAKGFIVIFTCNHCPYSVAYEDRIIKLDKKYKKKGYPVVAINPNNVNIVPGDSFEGNVKRAKEKNFSFPYLRDETQEIADAYGAQRTPHVYVLQKVRNDLIVKYIGAIDNNYKEPEAVTKTYLADAIDSLLVGKTPEPEFTKAIGCSVKRQRKVAGL